MLDSELSGLGSLHKLDSELFWVAASTTPESLKMDRSTGHNNMTLDTMNTASKSEFEALLPGLQQLPRGKLAGSNNLAEIWGGGFSYSSFDHQGILLIFFNQDSSAMVRLLWDSSNLTTEYAQEIVNSVVDMIKLQH